MFMLEIAVFGEGRLVELFKRSTDESNTTFVEHVELKETKETLGVTGWECDLMPLEDACKAVRGRHAIWMPRMALLPQKWGYGYYHFVLEMLPRILRVSRADPSIPILIWYNQSFIHSALAATGVRNPIVPYNPDKAFGAASCMTVTHTKSGCPSPEDVRMLREAMGVKDGEVGSSCILLRRDPNNRRTIVNQDQLFDALRVAFPSETWVEFKGEGSFADQVRLFRDAKLIVGAHGAGLSNRAFAPPTARVVEFMIAEEINLCHWHTSRMVSEESARRHTILMCHTEDAKRRIRVDPSEAVRLVGKALGVSPTELSPALRDLIFVERPLKTGVMPTDARILNILRNSTSLDADVFQSSSEFDATFLRIVDPSSATETFIEAWGKTKSGGAIYVEHADEKSVGVPKGWVVQQRWPNAFKVRVPL